VIGLAKANPKAPFEALRKWVGVNLILSQRLTRGIISGDKCLGLASATEGYPDAPDEANHSDGFSWRYGP
jgi:hypothetical protein